MKILWVNTNFLHPTTKGGQIRSLEMLRHLSRWHEIHYVAIENPDQPEGPARAGEYSFRAYPFRYRIPERGSFGFARQLAMGLVSPVPLAVGRFHPPGMKRFLEDLIQREGFDHAVVDHLAPMTYFPDRGHSLLFQHNVEFLIWRRHVEHAQGALRRFYFQLQADRMLAFERQACRDAGHVVACGEVDRKLMQETFGIGHVSDVPTGVNLEYFDRGQSDGKTTSRPDFVFVGSMDWLPNEQGVLWFAREILPRIRRKRPEATFAVVGRKPPAAIQALGSDPRITITGTVPDVRPWFWEGGVSVVPLLVGGGTRLKIYEAMAARSPVVSTSVGAEGLDYRAGETIRIADSADEFAAQCLELLEDGTLRERMAACAWEMVRAKYSWERVSRRFEEILLAGPRMRA